MNAEIKVPPGGSSGLSKVPSVLARREVGRNMAHCMLCLLSGLLMMMILSLKTLSVSGTLISSFVDDDDDDDDVLYSAVIPCCCSMHSVLGTSTYPVSAFPNHSTSFFARLPRP